MPAAAAALSGIALAGRAAAQDPLQDLIEQTQKAAAGQGFDAASRTIQMPKASLPTLSPATAQTTEQAVAHYDAIVARGGWPAIPEKARLRVGARHAGVVPLRQRLIAAGDLEANAGVTETFDTYVEGAVRRFQARHGMTVDGIVREQTLKALNVPAPVRLSQLKTNLARLRTLSGNLGSRLVVCNIPAAQIEAIQDGVAVTRHTAVAGKPDRRVARHPEPDHRDQFQSVLDRAGFHRPQGFDPENASRARLSHQEPHSHLRRSAAASSRRRISTGIRKRR